MGHSNPKIKRVTAQVFIQHYGVVQLNTLLEYLDFQL